jgi:hypothetical protein
MRRLNIEDRIDYIASAELPTVRLDGSGEHVPEEMGAADVHGDTDFTSVRAIASVCLLLHSDE